MECNVQSKTLAEPERKSAHMDAESVILKVAVYAAAVVMILIPLILIGYILIRGLPNLRWSLFAWEYNSTNVSMMPAIINTITTTVLALLPAMLFGIGGAIYLTEYARKESFFVKCIDVTAETLAGIPSIVYGLFGYLTFCIELKFNFSLLSGALTLAIMVLPVILQTTKEALIAVPESYREGSLGLGAGKFRTIVKIALPSAIPGILSGVILAIGRIVGETAALIYTAGTVAGVPDNIMNSGRTLSVHMYALLSEGLYMDEAYATAVVLLLIVAGINWAANRIAKMLRKKHQ
ncbi:MAG: phosphate ABC transporter permease PstA [Lachnospiraceae bacterium]|nr:phosphate ABC transporter permease PstA [Lachnospiraceae bacterium]